MTDVVSTLKQMEADERRLVPLMWDALDKGDVTTSGLLREQIHALRWNRLGGIPGELHFEIRRRRPGPFDSGGSP